MATIPRSRIRVWARAGYLGLVTRWLPFLYLPALALELAALAALYAWLQPAAGSLTNVIVGSIGLLCMIAMLVYSIARRSKLLRSWMRLSTWLHLHIFLGLQGIGLAYVHCLPLLWRGGSLNPLNPGMLNLYALTVVFASGLFGRYLFAQVPKTVGGQHLAAQELDAELSALEQPVPAEVRALWSELPVAGGVLGMLAASRGRRRALAKLRGLSLEPEVATLAARRITLESQKSVMTSACRVFWLWIVLHRPVAIALYLISFVHLVLGLLYTPSLGLF